ncbi:MAG: lipid A deacylase LpxR family protein [Desulfobacterales bacterium]|nr:lipid A deacylase LpxR family protein [Desulfobacterales bacterium]
MQSSRLVLAAMVSILLLWTARQSPLCAQDFYLDSPRNIGTLRLEIDNDIVWDDDSGFTNGWSIQYHTVCYPGWEESETIRWVKWVGSNFPALGDGDSVIRYSHGFGQNMITPGNLAAEIPQQGDLPYAGTLTYSLNWQRFNRKTARSFQISVGVLGEASLAEPFQKFVHDDLGGGEDPKGWDTQRDTEPIVNIGYQYSWCLADWGGYHDDWAGQLTLAPSASLGNLFTAAELVVAFRTGWNMPEGFSSYAAPPGRGFIQASQLPKPSDASPHGVELILGARGTALAYSVIYDGSLVTDDDRDVDRNRGFVSYGVGLYYHYYDLVSICATVEQSTGLIKSESLPTPPGGHHKTEGDVSYGALIVDVHF